MAVAKSQNFHPATEIAVLQNQVENLKNDINELKNDIKCLNASIVKTNENTQLFIKEMKEAHAIAHQATTAKLTALEKWRWMMMGAGVALGALGFKTLGAVFGI